MFESSNAFGMTPSERSAYEQLIRDAGRGFFWLTVRSHLREVRAAFREIPVAVKVYFVATGSVLVLMMVGVIGVGMTPSSDAMLHAGWNGFLVGAMSSSVALPFMLAVVIHGAYRDRMRRLLTRDYLMQLGQNGRSGRTEPPR